MVVCCLCLVMLCCIIWVLVRSRMECWLLGIRLGIGRNIWPRSIINRLRLEGYDDPNGWTDGKRKETYDKYYILFMMTMMNEDEGGGEWHHDKNFHKLLGRRWLVCVVFWKFSFLLIKFGLIFCVEYLLPCFFFFFSFFPFRLIRPHPIRCLLLDLVSCLCVIFLWLFIDRVLFYAYFFLFSFFFNHLVSSSPQCRVVYVLSLFFLIIPFSMFPFFFFFLRPKNKIPY